MRSDILETLYLYKLIIYNEIGFQDFIIALLSSNVWLLNEALKLSSENRKTKLKKKKKQNVYVHVTQWI